LNLTDWLHSRSPYRITYSTHFWILVTLMVIITTFYYVRLFYVFHPQIYWQLEIFEYQTQFQGSLYCIPLIYSTIVFRLRGALVTALIAAMLVIPSMIFYRPFILSIVTNLFFLFIPLIVMGYLTLELNWRNKERQTMHEREEERQEYVSQIFNAQEKERKRIAQELHDDAINSLLVIANTVQNMINNDLPKKSKNIQQAEEIRDGVLRVSDDLRRLSLDLRPGILDNIGLLPALRWLVSYYSDEALDIQLEIYGEERTVLRGHDVIVFRIVQEALNNIRKHSGASRSTIGLFFDADAMRIVISDNGKGFVLPKRFSTLAARGKLGLTGIKERTRSLNGTLEINSVPESGTTITISLKA
jgi:signal transduction histidine kinase